MVNLIKCGAFLPATPKEVQVVSTQTTEFRGRTCAASNAVVDIARQPRKASLPDGPCANVFLGVAVSVFYTGLNK